LAIVKAKLLVVVFSVIVLSILATAADSAKPATPASNDLMTKVAKIKVGSTTGEQVTELLGAPYRSSSLGCSGEDNGEKNPNGYDVIWEYLGHDVNGTFLIHMEFDDDGVVRIVAKVPRNGPIKMLASSPKPAEHQH
jgi:hypothetical protein